MNAALRAHAILADPAAEWTKIEVEPGDVAHLLTSYVALLALIPAISGFIGACVIGVVVPGGATLRAPVLDGLFGAVFAYVMTCAAVLVLALVINLAAPMFASRRGLIPRSSLPSIPIPRSGWPGFFCWRRACASSCSPAFTAFVSYGSACRL